MRASVGHLKCVCLISRSLCASGPFTADLPWPLRPLPIATDNREAFSNTGAASCCEVSEAARLETAQTANVVEGICPRGPADIEANINHSPEQCAKWQLKDSVDGMASSAVGHKALLEEIISGGLLHFNEQQVEGQCCSACKEALLRQGQTLCQAMDLLRM